MFAAVKDIKNFLPLADAINVGVVLRAVEFLRMYFKLECYVFRFFYIFLLVVYLLIIMP